jgi:hypothetical protein
VPHTHEKRSRTTRESLGKRQDLVSTCSGQPFEHVRLFGHLLDMKCGWSPSSTSRASRSKSHEARRVDLLASSAGRKPLTPVVAGAAPGDRSSRLEDAIGPCPRAIASAVRSDRYPRTAGAPDDERRDASLPRTTRAQHRRSSTMMIALNPCRRAKTDASACDYRRSAPRGHLLLQHAWRSPRCRYRSENS